MCGIAGVVDWHGRDVPPEILRKMADSVRHRGPDEEGFYISRATRNHPIASAGLAHRRLSIIDLSGGQQPLSNEDGTIWIIFNGEIYNFRGLRADLSRRGHCFRTNSDTEVIVHAYEEWGTECLRRLNGMFAFAIWDERKGSVFIARDRIGQKPLYYQATDDSLIFGSELKAILAHPDVETRIDPTAVADYFKYLYIPDPKTIFQGINKLSAGHYLLARQGKVSIEEYWDVSFEDSLVASDSELEEYFFDLLDQAVHDRMIADVPLGAFLSGGVDSSAIVALMARHSPKSVLTCAIGFDDPEHDESQHAADVASYLGTEHHAFVVKDDLLGIVQRIPAMFDEPFADSSAIPTYHICNRTRRHVTVALSGDGGDETFAGYDKYTKGRLEQLCGHVVPDPLLAGLNRFARGNGTFPRKLRTLTNRALLPPDRAYYESNTFISDEDLDRLLIPDLAKEVKNYDPSDHFGKFYRKSGAKDQLSCMLYTDIKTYLPGDILAKVDRTSMANALEVRSPFLDYRVVEFAAGLHNRMRMRWGSRKYLLKRAFRRVLPPRTFRRPKHGFTVPLDSWFRNELTTLAKQVFFETPSTAQLLNVNYIRKIWEEHRARKAEHGTLLWAILVFSLWQRDRDEVPSEKGVISYGKNLMGLIWPLVCNGVLSASGY